MINTWENCYDDTWKGVITEPSFTHPAKFSRGLIRRIYSHAVQHGWLKPGDTVLDPFGGVGLGALHAGYYGVNWLGVELEQKFVTLGQGMECEGVSRPDYELYQQDESVASGRRWCPDCLARIKREVEPESGIQASMFDSPREEGYITQPHYFEGNLDLFRRHARHGAWSRLLQGDSRRLVEVVGVALANGVISSPPYSDSNQNYQAGWSFIDKDKLSHNRFSKNRLAAYGDESGQLGQFPKGELDGVISSPPYAQTRVAKNSDGIDLSKLYETYRSSGGGMSFEAFCEQQRRHSHEYGDSIGQLSNLPQGSLDGIVSSPPFVESIGSDDPQKRGGILASDPKRAGDRNLTGSYGTSAGQLGVMAAGSLDGVVSSPPYEGSLDNGTVDKHARVELSRNMDISNAEHISPIDMESVGKRDFQSGYGSSDGNLGSMKGGFDGVIGSPPYGNRTVHQGGIDADKLISSPGQNSQALVMTNYGACAGQLANDSGKTFWGAARQVVERCYILLAPGAPAIWVCKDFVRNKERVNFCDMWRRLCESVGFETVEINRAMLVKSKGVRVSLDGEEEELVVERKGFFRRLAEKKGSPSIDWEEVIIMRKPPA